MFRKQGSSLLGPKIQLITIDDEDMDSDCEEVKVLSPSTTFEPKTHHTRPDVIHAEGDARKQGVLSSRLTELPPRGIFNHTEIEISQQVYAMTFPLSPWSRGHIISIKEDIETQYEVQFDIGGKTRFLTRKYIAYAQASPVQFSVGARVIAQNGRGKFNIKYKPPFYYAGVIIEPPKYANQFRYLIFFDDGYAQYCPHEQIMMVCQSSKDVWHDIHVVSRSFISHYLNQYPERSMVKLHRGQMIKTESNGQWCQGRVEAVDASLANVYFVSEKRYEWIYRGSTRFRPLYDLLTDAEAKRIQEVQLIYCKKNNAVFEPHQCSKKCVQGFPYVETDLKNCNPLAIPILCGWSRELAKHQFGEGQTVVYRAPCGRRMRNPEDVHRFLGMTGCQLGIDLYCFNSLVRCFAKYEPVTSCIRIEDITDGRENVRISCVNSIDGKIPDRIDYCTDRITTEGVNLNLNPDFLVCCDCTDDCKNKEKCQCWQLTISATALGPSRKIDKNAGYQYRRLMQYVLTGIYECNSRCSCRVTCLNRVVQRPLNLRLQLFRTENRGWGIRCIDDIPKGQFICVFAGQLLTEQVANENGKRLGDEYLLDLNFIEAIELNKNGYESDVVSDDDKSNEACTKEKPSSSSPTSSPIKNGSHLTLKARKNGDRVVKTRDLYGSSETCYVIDAKKSGNIGRYFNHSCKPNVFVQNVFIDTQDLRFPWTGFFSNSLIRAGTELTWDYNYTVGSVPEKKIDCLCGAKKCRKRLL